MEKRCENMINSWIKELSETKRSHNTAKVYLHDLQKFIGYVYRYINERKPLENHIQTHLLFLLKFSIKQKMKNTINHMTFNQPITTGPLVMDGINNPWPYY